MTHAVAREGIEVQPPYDLMQGHDFFTDEGRGSLEELESDPHLGAEHWAPCCKLFSRARGRPVTLPSGEVVPGPQPVRDKNNLYGFRWLNTEMKKRLRHSNTMATRSISRLRTGDEEGRIATLEHPYNSWIWYWPSAEELQDAHHYDFSQGSMCCFGGKREKWFALLGNSEEIEKATHQPTCPGHTNLRPYEVRYDQNGRLVFDTEEESEYPVGWCIAYAKGLRKAFENRGWLYEAVYEGRRTWVLDELFQSTDRLKEENTARDLAGDIVRMELTMMPGNEETHLKEMLRRLTIRGTELKLLFQEIQEEVPYPAYRWYFKKVFSFKWKADLHINEGELNAFIAMAERRGAHSKKHGTRYLAILDSRVIRGALGKGRSSSRPLNRGLKKVAALMIASDAFPLLAWTITKRTHLKFAGLQRRSLAAYNLALKRFMSFARKSPNKLRSAKDLDFTLAEYLNSMYQEGDPVSSGGHTLSAIKRFLPDLRLSLPISSQYHRNWQRTHRPIRAVPISWELLRAMATVAWSQGAPQVALMLFVGFNCFLRTSEFLSLQYCHLLPHKSKHEVAVVIPFSKTSNGNAQVLIVKDANIWALATHLVSVKPPNSLLWAGTPHEFRKLWGTILTYFDHSPLSQ